MTVGIRAATVRERAGSGEHAACPRAQLRILTLFYRENLETLYVRYVLNRSFTSCWI